MADVLVRYFAAARAASGMSEEQLDASDIGDALAQLTARHGADLAAILKVSSLLLDGVHVCDHAAVLPDGCCLDVLPPFAGG